MRAPHAIAAVLVAAALPACSGAPPPAAEPTFAVGTARVATAGFAQRLELTGTVSARRRVTLGSASAGTIVALSVQVGDRVAAGQVVAQVDASRYRAQVAQAQGSRAAAAADTVAARAQLDAAQTRARLAGVTAERMSELYAQGAISKQRYDETQASLASARAGVEQAQASLRAARDAAEAAGAGVAAAAAPLADTIVRAPFAGVIVARSADVGAVAGPGSPIVTLEDESNLEIDAAVPEEAVSALGSGGVSVTVDALGGRMLPGRIRAIVPNENPALRSAMLKVAIPPAPGLMAGMFARIAVPGPGRRALAVPAAALVTRAGQDGVFVVRDGHARFIPVQTGTLQGRNLEVRGQVHPGDEAVVRGAERLTEGAAVSTSPA